MVPVTLKTPAATNGIPAAESGDATTNGQTLFVDVFGPILTVETHVLNMP